MKLSQIMKYFLKKKSIHYEINIRIRKEIISNWIYIFFLFELILRLHFTSLVTTNTWLTNTNFQVIENQN